MTVFVQVKNGFVNGQVVNADIAAASMNLHVFNNSAAQDYDFKTNSRTYQEILRAARVLIGEDFRGFLSANYKNGFGPIANLVSGILHYLNNKASARSVIKDIAIAESIVYDNNSIPNGWEKRSVKTNKESTPPIFIDNITNFDYYRLLRGIGIENLSRLLLVVLGENRYVK